MPDVTPEATPGQAAYEAHFAALRDTFDSPPWAWERLPHHLSNAWDAAAGAVMLMAQAAVDYAELASLREQLRQAEAGRDAAREELADAKTALQYWPLCPDGCGCRIGATGPDGENDADAQECACDGPCCMECRENGYPDAPSYRDLAVKHVMDDLTEAREIIEALREDHGRTDRYRAALQPEAMAARYHRALAAAHADGRQPRQWRDLGLPEQEAWRGSSSAALAGDGA